MLIRDDLIMDITAKVDYKAKGKKWSDIKAHVDRLHKNGHYSNTNINLDKSDYNYQGYIHNAKKDNDYYFLPYIQFQNLRKASTGHKNEIYKSVNDYFKKRGYSNQRNSMFEIGNQDYRKKYYKILEKKGLTDKQIRKIEAKSLIDDVIEYDKNSCQSVGAFAVNCDEKTAHIHFQNLSYPPKNKFGKKINLMPRGKKWRRKLKNNLIKIGINPKTAENIIHQKKFYFDKPSASFNNTWQLEFPNAKNKEGQFDSSKALHLANDRYSHMIINNFNKELAKAGVKDFRLHLIRTHNVNDKDYKQWLSSKVANDKLKKANNSLMADNNNLKANRSSITTSLTNNAVSEAEPIINRTISSANDSTSISASNSVSSTISSINNSIATSNAEWQSKQTSINNSLVASASSSVKSSSANASYSLSSAVNSLNTANEKWQSYIEKNLSESVRNKKSSTVSSINSHLTTIYNNQSLRTHSLSQSLSTWDSELASSANNISLGSSSISAASLSNANYSHELDKREQRIRQNKTAHDDLLAHNIMLAMPRFNDMSKPMQRSTALAYDNNGKLNFNKVKKLFITGFYRNQITYQPPYGIATGHSVVKGTAMLVYLYGYDAQHAINTANLQSILNNTEDYEKNANKAKQSNNDDLQL